MIYIFGDSHGNSNFREWKTPHINLSNNSITMYRIGRDQQIINFDGKYNSKDSIFIFCYGEVDCRCHIGRQIDAGGSLHDISNGLVNNYFKAIKNNISTFKKIIVCSIVPPMQQRLYEQKNGPITHEFPFIHSDEDRVKYTKQINNLIKLKCSEFNYTFLDFYDRYADSDGTLKYDLSDAIVHIGPDQNIFIIESTESLIGTH